MENYVAFPGLGLSFNINPVAFTLFGKDVYWYGIIIGTALIIAMILSMSLEKHTLLPKDTVLDIVLWATIPAIICARVYYCIFRFEDYKDNLTDVFKIWEGGIAIYGAVIGAVLTAYIYCRVKKINWKSAFDICIIGVITGQCIGRWGNFVNKEAFGTQTTLPWRMEIYQGNAPVCVHPTFLYESIWNLIGIFVLLYINRHKKNDGETFFSYLIWYGIGRTFIEGLRTDSLYLGPVRISQLVAAVTAIAGMALIAYYRTRKKEL